MVKKGNRVGQISLELLSRISSHCRALRAVEMQASVMLGYGKEALGFSKRSENRIESQMGSCSQDVEAPRNGQL